MSKEHDEFMIDYNNKHKYCPVCGSEEYQTTLKCYILDVNHKEDYKDLNKCGCSNCGCTHLFHDRVDKIYNIVTKV